MTAKKRQADGGGMSPDIVKAVAQLSSTALVAAVLGYFIYVLSMYAMKAEDTNLAITQGQQEIIRECLANASKE